MAAQGQVTGVEVLEGVDPEAFRSVRFLGTNPSTKLQYSASFVRTENDIRTDGRRPFDFGPTMLERPWIGLSPQGTKGELEKRFGQGLPEDNLVELAQRIREFSGGVIEIDPFFGAVRNGRRKPFDNDENLFLQIGVTDDSPEVSEDLRGEFDRYNVIPELTGEIAVGKAMDFTPQGIAELLGRLSQESLLVSVEAQALSVGSDYRAYHLAA